MYASGADHPLKQPSTDVLLLVQSMPTAFVTSAEVFQEIIHRYTAVRRWVEGRALFEEFSFLMAGRIEPIYFRDTLRAAALADAPSNASARDLLHAAVMQRLGVRNIVSADPDFDSLPGIKRLDPMKVDEWRDTVTA